MREGRSSMRHGPPGIHGANLCYSLSRTVCIGSFLSANFTGSALGLGSQIKAHGVPQAFRYKRPIWAKVDKWIRTQTVQTTCCKEGALVQCAFCQMAGASKASN